MTCALPLMPSCCGAAAWLTDTFSLSTYMHDSSHDRNMYLPRKVCIPATRQLQTPFVWAVSHVNHRFWTTRRALLNLLKAKDKKQEDCSKVLHRKKKVWPSKEEEQHLMAVSIICLWLIIQLSRHLTLPSPTPPQAGGPLQPVMAMLPAMTQACGLRALLGTPLW